MRDLLVALFWAWLAVSVSIYLYRLFRRITRGSKAAREARAAAAEGRTAGLGAAGEPSAPVLPRSLAGTVPEVATAPPAATPGASGPAPNNPGPTVVEALRGIDLPCDLVPVADGTDADVAGGRRVVFTTRAATVRTVAAALGDELERLGYRVSNAATEPDVDHQRLVATRTGVTLSVAVAVDEAGAVAAEVTT